MDGNHLSASWTRLRRATERSMVATWVSSVGALFVLAARSSRLRDAVRRGGGVARKSWVYRQLTMDTQPSVVTLDLRETLTLGPLLAAVDRLPGTGGNREVRDSSAVFGLWESVRARPVQTVSVVVGGAVAANLLGVVLFESPSRVAIGARLLVGIVALLGTGVRASPDQVADSYTGEVAAQLLTPVDRPEQSADDDSGNSVETHDDSSPEK